jgi:hypothetical protein
MQRPPNQGGLPVLPQQDDQPDDQRQDYAESDTQNLEVSVAHLEGLAPLEATVCLASNT